VTVSGVEDAESLLAFVRSRLGTVRNVHQGFMPEIQLTGRRQRRECGRCRTISKPTVVTTPIMRGYGHYHEMYCSDPRSPADTDASGVPVAEYPLGDDGIGNRQPVPERPVDKAGGGPRAAIDVDGRARHGR
jgi:hypothetical protein